MATIEPRMDRATFGKVAASAGKAVLALSEAALEAGLEKPLLELVKLRVSQINGCAFCVQYHLTDARKLGIAQEKLDLLVTWREAPIFSDRERAALGWAEALTLLATRQVSDADHAQASAAFDETKLANLTAAIGAINVWNRIAVGFRFAPQVAPDRLAEAA